MISARGSRSAMTPPKSTKTMLLIVNAASTSDSERASLSMSSTANASAIDDIDPVMSVIALARKNQRKLRSCMAPRPRTGVGASLLSITLSSCHGAALRSKSANGSISGPDAALCAL